MIHDKYLNFWKALYVAVSFFFLFIAFNSTQNLTTEVSERINNLEYFGYIQLSVLYMFVALSSLVAPSIVKKLGWKRSFLFGGLGHFIFIFLSVFPAWSSQGDQENLPAWRSKAVIETVLIICVSINGFGSAVRGHSKYGPQQH